MKTVAVIPCLNEEKHIAGVVRAARRYVNTVIVSDGGSVDSTVLTAHSAGAKVYLGFTDDKRGYGANMRAGILRAINKYGADVVVILDGDGQHDPDDIPRFLAGIKYGYDAVMGNRAGQPGMPAYRLFGNKVISMVCNTGARQVSKDALCGFWAVRADKLPQLTEKKWGIMIEMLVKLRSNGNRLMSVPVRTIYHEDYKDNSTLGPVKLAVLLLKAIIKWRIKCEVFKR